MSFALKYRPKNIDEFFGQENITSPYSAFRKLLEQKSLPHVFFFGPAGSGKTSLARIIANAHESPFFELDASSVKVEEIRKIINEYKGGLFRPVIFIDEVHRLSKTQQEVLLLPMENNQAHIIGASTENPYHVLSSGIRSRSLLLEFKPLNQEALSKILDHVLLNEDFSIDKEAREYLIFSSSNDARAMLNLLDFAIKIDKNVSLDTLKSLRPYALKDGVSSSDTHYNLTSALIKSLRGSDVDAALYYLARLIDGGENPVFLARRLVIFSSEDIGNANPNALNLATSTMLTCKEIGYPEARILLSQCVVYLASSPKSNASYKAINTALAYVKNNPPLSVLPYLKNHDKESKNYLYPHDFGGWVEQKYLEKELKFYQSNKIGYEKILDEWERKKHEK